MIRYCTSCWSNWGDNKYTCPNCDNPHWISLDDVIKEIMADKQLASRIRGLNLPLTQ